MNDEDEEIEEVGEEARKMAMVMRNDVLSGIAKMDYKKVLACLLSTWSMAVDNGVLVSIPYSEASVCTSR